ncbi:MAG: FAD-binding oxidoreductase [Candidatus Paceibacterota bacterium]
MEEKLNQIKFITEEISKICEGEVESSPEILEKYSTDASLFKIKPEVVVFPKHSKDISELVKWVSLNKSKYPDLSLTVRAAGTCMAGGPLNTSIILDTTKYMNKIISVENTDIKQMKPMFPGSASVNVSGRVVVEPGCFYRDFEKAVGEKGLLLPSFTASKSINAVGGMVGNNSAGELTLRYGKTEDYIAELSFIFEDGNEYTLKPISKSELESKMSQSNFEGSLYKKIFDLIDQNKDEINSSKPQVSKNSAGYTIWNVWNDSFGEEVFDLPKLIAGSQGTLGIVTKITFNLVEIPKASKLLVVFLNDLSILGNLVYELKALNPQSIESYDDKTFGLAMKFFGDFVKQKGFWGSIKFGLSFLPEFFMVISGGVPKLILLIEFSGNDEKDIQQKCLDAQNKVSHFKLKTRITRSIAEADKYWAMRRDSFALLRKHVKGMRTAPFIDDIVVNPECLPEFLPKLNNLLDDYPYLVYTIAGHAGNGNFHIIPLVDMNDERIIPTILELSDKVYDLVAEYKGSITAEHNDGIIRTPYLNKMYSQKMLSIFEDVKNIFDPKNIFNPGKKVGTTKDDIVKYLAPPDHPHTKHTS